MNNLHLTKAVQITDTTNSSSGTFSFGASTSNPNSTFTLDAGVALSNTNPAKSALSVTGGGGNNMFVLGNLFTGTLNGGGGKANVLRAPVAATGNQNYWTITGSNQGTLVQTGSATPLAGSIAFSNMQNLTGGVGDNTFIVNPNGTMGDLTGGSGANKIYVNATDASGNGSTVVAGGAGTTALAASISTNSGGNTITVYQGGSVSGAIASNQLKDNQADSITVNGSVGSISDAGNGANTITVNGTGNVSGTITVAGSGANQVNVAGTVGGLITGSTSGTLNVQSASKSVQIGTTTPNGVKPDYQAAGFGTLTDLATDGTLIWGTGNNSAWSVTGTNSGSVKDLASKVTASNVTTNFNNFANLHGGDGIDTFSVSTGSIGTINTGLGADSITLASPAVVTVAGSTSTSSLIGGSGTDDLTVQSSNNTWTMTSTNSGSVSSGGGTPIYFSGFTGLHGVSNDTLDYSGVGTSVPVDLNKISGVGTVIGNYGTPNAGTTIIGWDTGTNAWNIGTVTVAGAATDGLNDGTVSNAGNGRSLIFENVTQLNGGRSGATSNNDFTLVSGSGAFDGAINGSNGNGAVNTLTARGDLANTWTVNSSKSTLAYNNGAARTTSFAAIQQLNGGGGAGSNDFTVDASVSRITSTGTGTNKVNVGAASQATVNSVTLGNGGNTVNVNATGNIGTLTLGATGSGTADDNVTIDGSVGSIAENNNGTNTIAVNNSGNVSSGITLTGTGTNTVNAGGTIGGVIDGGAGNDILNITATGNKTVQLGSTVTSGADYTVNQFTTINAYNAATGNTLRADNATSTWTVSATNSGTVQDVVSTGFTNFANLEAGAGANNLFNINAAIGSISANGNNGNTVNVNGPGAVTGNIDATGTGTNQMTVAGSVSGLITGGGANTTLTLTNSGQNVQIGTTAITGAPTPMYQVANIGNLIANAGDSLIWGASSDSNWTVNSTGHAGTVGTTNFTGFSNLWGGTGNNTFTVNGDIGAITAAGQMDKVTVAAGTSGSINLSGTNNTIDVAGTVNGKVSVNGAAGSANSITVAAGGTVNGGNMNQNAIDMSGSGTNTVNLAGSVTGIITGSSANIANNTINIIVPGKTVQLGTSIVSGGAPDYVINNIGQLNGVDDPGNQSHRNSNVLIGYASARGSWTIDGVNSGRITAGGLTTNFANFGNLVGGDQGDAFTLNNNGGSTSGELTGWQDGSRSPQANPSSFTINSNALFTFDVLATPPAKGSIYNDPNNNTVSVYNFGSTDGKNTQISSLNNNNVWVIHTAANNVDTVVDLYINGSNTSTTTFKGGYISGGVQDDTFIWNSGAMAGGVSGGSGGVNSLIISNANSGAKTVMLDAAGSSTTSGDSTHMPVQNMQYVVANNNAANTLVGSNASTLDWHIQPVSLSGIVTNNTALGGTLPASTSANSGTVSDGANTTTFTGFGNLQGGANGSNTYTLINGGRLSGYINGNGVADHLVLDPSLSTTPMTVRILNAASGSSANASTISIYNVGNVTGTDSGTTANDTLVGMAGSGFIDTWLINGDNSGLVNNGTGAGSQSVNFVNIGNLVANTGDDNFTVSGAGSLSGVIQGNGGTDNLNVTLNGATNGQIYFNANNGTTANVQLNGNAGDGVYTPPSVSSPYDQIQYTTGGNVYAVNYAQAATVTDAVTANSLTVHGAATSSTIALSSTATSPARTFDFQVNSNTQVGVSGKSQLDVAGMSGNDSIALTTGLDLTGMTVSLSGQNVTQSTGTLAADTLNVNNAGNVGTSGNRLSTQVAHLNIQNSGPVYLDQTGVLDLSGMNTGGLVNITASSDVGSTASLASTGALDITAGGNIDLAGANQFTGPVSLSGANVSLNNSTDLLLGDITATSGLSVTGTQNITQLAGSRIVSTNASGDLLATFGTANSGNILLGNADNAFNHINVTGGNTVEVNSKTSIGLQTLQANDVALTTAGSILNVAGAGITNITASTVSLNAVDGIGTGQISVTNNKFTVNPTNTVTLNTANLSATNKSATPGSAAIVLQNGQDVTVKDLRNNGDIYLNNTGNITMAVTQTATGNIGAIDANYGGALTAKTFYGNVALVGNGTNSVYTLGYGIAEADITAENLYVANVNQFGTSVQPIRLNIHNQFSLLAGTGAVAYPFLPPANVTTTADLTTFSGLNSLSGEQLINIESLGDVDPAIFTAVRNYDHEDVAILMPPDQRLGDDQECTDNDKKCKKARHAVN